MCKSVKINCFSGLPMLSRGFKVVLRLFSNMKYHVSVVINIKSPPGVLQVPWECTDEARVDITKSE